MNRNIIYRYALITIAMLAMAFSATAQQAPMTVTATADSTTLVMGDRTTVNVEVVKNSHDGALIGLPEINQDYHGLELSEIRVDSTDLGNNRVRLMYHITFQAFDPADILTLPGFRYVVKGDTAISDILTFKVLPVDLSPELGDPAQPDSLRIHPDATIASVNAKWYDYIPDWLVWSVLGLAIAGLLFVLWRLYKKNGPKLFVPRKPIPPYELAIRDLNALKEKKLIENGNGKEFYTEATDIWRRYLEGRFRINAMEMTSGQIVDALRDNKETHLTADQMQQVLEVSDFVKFANLHPTSDEMLHAYNTIYRFVESTRPLPQDEEDKPTDKPEKKKKK